jgi:hypothetical protein
MARTALVVTVVMVVGAASALAQDTPYAGYQHREIKALSAEEVEGYLAGAGMGFALAAELNGYPGPKHVLQLADSLGLDDGQRAAVAVSRERMLARAVPLGEAIVAAERTLDSLFASGAIEAERLAELTVRIGTLTGELRGVHLAAHLEMVAVLSGEQVARYNRLRGYGDPAHGEHRHGQH